MFLDNVISNFLANFVNVLKFIYICIEVLSILSSMLSKKVRAFGKIDEMLS